MVSKVRPKRILASLVILSAIALYLPTPFAAPRSARSAAPQATSTSRPSLDYEFFKTRVEPIFIKKRWPDHARCYVCHEVSRHGGGPLGLEALPAGASFWTEEQSHHNFEVVSKLVIPGDPLSSLLLLMPLAPEAGGLADTHQGGRQFRSKDDPDWKNMEAWVRGQKAAAQQFRLFRPDLPGFGRSTAPRDFEWSQANFAKVVVNFLDAIGVASAHIIGAKTGGAIAMQFAATYPQRTRTLVVASGPFSSVDPATDNNSQQVRLGSSASKEEMAYFDKLRDETSPETRRGVGKMMANFSLENLLPQISAPTLVITSDRSKLQSVETVLRYQPKIPRSRLLVLTSDAYHVAVAKADECVTNVLAFIRETKQP